MNMSQVRVLLQYLVTIGAGYLAGAGYMDHSTATELLTAIAALVPALYGVWKSRTAAKIDAAAKVPGVTVIAPDKLASNSTKPNVLTATNHEVVPK